MLTVILNVAFATPPMQLVALGDGLVAGAPAERSEPSTPANWVNILEDCLRERQPGRWTVADRTRRGETAQTAVQRIDVVNELQPTQIVLALGAHEVPAGPGAPPDRAAFETALRSLAEAVSAQQSPPHLLLLGIVPPLLSQVDGGDPFDQGALDARVSAWNEGMQQLASSNELITHLDLWTSWPRQRAPRSALTHSGFSLSVQGHAHVANAVCEAITR